MRTMRPAVEAIPPPKLVTVAVDTGSAYGRAIFRGASRYALAHTSWQLVSEVPSDLEKQLRKGQERLGVLLQSNKTARERFLIARGVTVVNVSNFLRKTYFPRVANDDAAVGRMGARYFLECGFRTAAWCGAPGIRHSSVRGEEFMRVFKEAGGRAVRLDYSTETSPRAVQKWLVELPRPCALMAFNDQRAQNILRLAQELGLRVPEDLAVLGVDNDELACWSHPHGLSSVQTDGERVGQVAACTLNALLRGEAVPAEQMVPPVETVSRGSTDMLAVGDTALNRAMQLINSRNGCSLLVDEVARHAGVSRRALEMRFRKNLNRTVLGEIIRHRIRHAARLLRETNLSVEEIAGKVGYAETRQFSSVFRNAMGSTPRDYRKQTQRI